MATAQIKGVSPRRNGGTPNLSMNGGVSPAQIADYSREASPGYMRPRQDSPGRAHQQQMQMQMQQMQRRAASPGRMPPQATQQRDPRMVPRAQMIPQAGPDARARSNSPRSRAASPAMGRGASPMRTGTRVAAPPGGASSGFVFG